MMLSKRMYFSLFLIIIIKLFFSNLYRANQRLSNNNETVNLKAQVKILEMRVNGLQSQIEQKNRENEELSNIVNELIANQKS